MSKSTINQSPESSQDGAWIVDGCDTVQKLFLKKTAERGSKTAMREKDFGIWQTWSWDDYRQFAMDVAHGLLSLGLEKGDVVAIQSEDCREWVFSDLGIMLARGVVNGVYPTYQPNQLAYTLQDSGCRFLFVEDEEQLDKFLEVEDELPGIDKVVVFDWQGLRALKHDRVMRFETLCELGREYGEAHPGQVEEFAAESHPDDLALLIYTSGTTGMPKGAMIPQRYLMFQTSLTVDFEQTEADEILTYLPLCHVAERIFSICLPLAHGGVINFAESPETVAQDFRELSPTFVFAVPRVWEKFYSRVSTAMSEATWIGRTAYNLGVRLASPRADKLIAGQEPNVLDKFAYWLADVLMFRNIKELLGLDRARLSFTGAAPISKSLLRWFLTIGIPITEVYGQTEVGIVTLTRQRPLRQGTVGEPLPGIDLRIADDGEILVRHPHIFDGYLNLPEKTSETIVDGWVHTGDVGLVDENGQLRITDRMKDIIITAGGKNVTPSLIENELKFSPYISDAVVIGDRRKFLSCLIMIDKDNVEHYAQTHSIPFTDYRSLCARQEIVSLIEEELRSVNRLFSQVEQVKQFRLIDVLLTAEDEELTPTMKLKRSYVSSKYNALIEDMYGGRTA